MLRWLKVTFPVSHKGKRSVKFSLIPKARSGIWESMEMDTAGCRFHGGEP